MKGVIMAGGFGTRMRPLTCNIPKPMIPVMNVPVMEHIVKLLKKHEITDIVSILYYQPEIIRNYFQDGSKFGVSMTYVLASENYDTAGSVKNSQKYLKDESFIIISGDILTDFDLNAAIKFHQDRKALATITLTRVTNPLAFGIVIIDERGKVVRFLEKPSWGEVFSDTINTGIYILQPEIFEYIPKEKEYDFSKDLFPSILAKEMELYGYVAKGYWKDIGDLEEYRQVHYDIFKGKVAVDILGKRQNYIGKEVWIDENCQASDSVEYIDGVVVGKNCKIGKNIKLQNVILGNGCIVEDNTKIINSIIWNEVKIGRSVELRENVIGKNTQILDGAYLQEKALVSDECLIGKHSSLKDNVKIWPYKVVEDGAVLLTSLIWGERWSKNLFGKYGVVGLANVEITPEFASKLGASYGATFTKGSSIITSRDHHKACRMINRALMSGVLSTGVNVRDLGAIPLPVARYQIGITGEQGGLHVRRSPHAPNQLEISFFDSKGLDIPVKKEKAITQLFFREDFRRADIGDTGNLSFPYRTMEYYKEGFFDKIDKNLISQSDFKIVVDYGFGGASTVSPSIFGSFECEVLAINSHLDVNKINEVYTKTNAMLQQLSNIVVTLKADVGFMLDSEAERIFIVDDKGRILADSFALVLISSLLAQTYPESNVAVPVNITRTIEKLVKKVKRTKTAPRAMMEEKDIVMVGNGTGGFIFPQFQPTFDAMYTAVKVLELMAKSGLKLSELVNNIPPFFIAYEKVPCPWEKKGEIMREMIEFTKNENVELIDGIKVYHKEDWVLLIPDADRPFFHVYAESDSMEKAKALAYNYIDKIKTKL
ncbi:MAG: mannose-1-phosphate guanyltransferase [bacterium]|nr:mannose-1-phosphate guanyltransferase [bacterium]